jgi:beta-glucosidase
MAFARLAGFCLGLCALLPTATAETGAQRPWLDLHRSPDERAGLALAAMREDEKISLLHGFVALPRTGRDGVQSPLPAGALPSAGFVPGIRRLGIPALYETDAGLGVGNPGGVRAGDVATALPASIAWAATFDPSAAYAAGALVGSEARAKGFNVLLAGGMDLARDPRNGRNFEYLGEDPLLAGVLAGEAVRGVQAQHVISTVKHFALNANEVNRDTLDARIDRPALRESDLLAFEIAIERGHPGSVMCGYNLVNGAYACGNAWLLNDVLKTDWRFPGWVMSDWGAVHDVSYALSGLDQESGVRLGGKAFFDQPLKIAVAAGTIPGARVDDMVRRILRSMFALGIADRPPGLDIDYPSHAATALDIARKGIVLLKNAGQILPLDSKLKTIAVIGGHANAGVLAGGGSAQVIPYDASPLRRPDGGPRFDSFGELYDPSSPFDELASALTQTKLRYDSGAFPLRAAALAAASDIAIVFVTRYEREGIDIPDLDLPSGQGRLIETVAQANPHTVVVLETGNPVTMPWIDHVAAVLAAWYPGQEGGRAIADILLGRVNPSGRLPMTFPRDVQDFIRPGLPNLGSEPGTPVHIDYAEGADVGYRWYGTHGIEPLFAFGFGLSYTRFEYGDVEVSGGRTLKVHLVIRNSGDRAGAAVVQLYLTAAAGRRVLRLIGFERVGLEPGERRRIALEVDPRLLGSFDERRRRWRIERGIYQVRIGRSAGELLAGGEARIAGHNEN